MRHDNEAGKGDHRHVMGREEPYRFVSVTKLRRDFEADYKNVHTDVTRLIELGLIGRLPDQRIAVAWDTIAAEMKLAA